MHIARPGGIDYNERNYGEANRDEVLRRMTELRYPLFDGEKLWEAACVTIENGVIADVSVIDSSEVDSNCLLMPGLIDCHTHMTSEEQISVMLSNGITATCDVSAPVAMIQKSRQFRIINSAGMAMGFVTSGKGYVETAVIKGAEYIKVLLFDHNTISRHALRSMAKCAHEKGLKVAAHATSLNTYRLAVECDVDIILHVPLKEHFPEELAHNIAQKGIAVAPTLVMMEAFANSGRGGYRKSDYANAEAAVKQLSSCGVTILAGTDANIGAFAPAMGYGSTLHREMELLVKAGLAEKEALAAATGRAAAVFGISDAGLIAPGMPATMLLVEGRPDRDISDSRKVKKLWVQGKDAV